MKPGMFRPRGVIPALMLWLKPAAADDEFDNAALLAPWNDSLWHDDPMALWNDPLYQDDSLAPWNDPLAGEREMDDYLRSYGEDPDSEVGWE